MRNNGNNGNNGNLFDESIDEIRERIISYLKCFEETDLENHKKQYMLHVEYWGRVLQKMQK